jgi:hypothetical protein
MDFNKDPVEQLHQRLRSDQEFRTRFYNFLNGRLCSEYFDFWAWVESYKKLSPSEQPKVALQIQSVFINKDSLRRLNVEESLLEHTADEIAKNNFTPQLFDVLQRHILFLMSSCIPEFLASIRGVVSILSVSLSFEYPYQLESHMSCVARVFFFFSSPENKEAHAPTTEPRVLSFFESLMDFFDVKNPFQKPS